MYFFTLNSNLIENVWLSYQFSIEHFFIRKIILYFLTHWFHVFFLLELVIICGSWKRGLAWVGVGMWPTPLPPLTQNPFSMRRNKSRVLVLSILNQKENLKKLNQELVEVVQSIDSSHLSKLPN